MSENDVEAVARAICVAERMNDDDPLGGWRHWVDAARVAIEADPGRKAMEEALSRFAKDFKSSARRSRDGILEASIMEDVYTLANTALARARGEK